MGIILGLVAFALCAFVYVRMVRREIPEPLGKKQAVIPVVIGLAAPILGTALIIFFGLIMKWTNGMPLAGLSDSLIYKALVTSFIGAGFTEEFVKCLLFLLVVRILKPKNVYEVALFCVGIGVGFTLMEEVLYGAGSIMTALFRIPCFGLHAAHRQLAGVVERFGKLRYLHVLPDHILLGLFLPMLWHTLYDAATAFNTGLMVEDGAANTAGMIIALAAVVISVVLQFVVFIRFKKKSGEYCGMSLT